MQRATATSGSIATGPGAACPVCGDAITGIETRRPGDHRFVGCDHYASARFLRPFGDAGGPGAPRRRLGP